MERDEGREREGDFVTPDTVVAPRLAVLSLSVNFLA